LTRPQPPDLADVDLGPLPQRNSKAALLDDSDPIGPTSGANTNPQSQAGLGRIENLDGRRPTPPSKSGGDQLIGDLNGHAGSIFFAWIGPISSRTTKVLSAIWISAFSDIPPASEPQAMPKSSSTPAYILMRKALLDLRNQAGVNQIELAKRLGRQQSFVSNFERGNRGIDVIEFYAITRALGADPAVVFRELVAKLPKKVTI